MRKYREPPPCSGRQELSVRVQSGGQGTDDLRTIPILCADIFANNVARAVDHVAVRNLDGPVAMHDGLRRVADGKEIDVIFQQEIVVGLRVLVDADADDH